MIKSVTDANKDLIDLHKQMGDIEGESSSQNIEHHEQFDLCWFDKAVTRFSEKQLQETRGWIKAINHLILVMRISSHQA